jgi:hypothetical protein
MKNKDFDELVALKKIKQGTVAVEEAGFDEPDFEVSQSGADKAGNFWYHHKWKVVAAICILFVLGVMIWQMSGRKTYDINVIIAAASFEEENREFYDAELSDLGDSVGLEFVFIKDSGINDQITQANKTRFIGSLSIGRAQYYVLDGYVYGFYEEQLSGSFVKVRELSNGFTLYEVGK